MGFLRCILLAVPLYGISQNFDDIPKKDYKDLRVCTFNIKADDGESLTTVHFGSEIEKARAWRNRLPLVTELVEKARPDILGLQEVRKYQLDSLLKEIPSYYNWRGDAVKGSSYRPIFYNKARLKIIDSGTFWLNEKRKKGEPTIPGIAERACTWAKFITNDYRDKKILVLNTHLTTGHSESDKKVRAKQIKIILETLQKTLDPKQEYSIILTGDFNMGKSARNVIQQTLLALKSPIELVSSFKEATLANRSGLSWSYSNWEDLKIIIDHIFFNPTNFSLVHYHIANGIKMSDHNPVVVDLKFNP